MQRTMNFRPLIIGLATGVSLFFSSSTAHAQAFPKGSTSLSFGYGVGTFLGALNRNFDVNSDVSYSNMGPVYFKFEHAMDDHVGLGLNVAYATNEWNYRYEYDSTSYKGRTTRSTYSVLARFNYHIGSDEKFDPYVGFGLGYRDAKWTVEDDGPEDSGVTLKSLMPFGMEITFGFRYFFAPNFGLYAEVGAAKSVAQGGISVKF